MDFVEKQKAKNETKTLIRPTNAHMTDYQLQWHLIDIIIISVSQKFNVSTCSTVNVVVTCADKIYRQTR